MSGFFPIIPNEGDVPSTDILKSIIQQMYLPVSMNETPDEFVSHADLINSIRTSFPDVKPTDVYTVMLEMGFESQNIEGQLYWRVAMF